MRHRGTYIPPDTPNRNPFTGRTGIVVGAILSVGALTAVSSAVATAQTAPGADPEGTTTAPIPLPGHVPGRPSFSAETFHWAAGFRSRVHATPRLMEPASSPAGTVDPTPTSGSGAPVASATGSPTPALPSATASASASATASQSASASASASASNPPSASASASASPPASAPPTRATEGDAGRLFAATSPWNTLIPSGAATDAQSGQVVARVLNNRDLVVNLNMYAFGIPFYTATASTPRVRIGGADGLGAIPLDPSWRPNDGADHKMNIIDASTRTVYELQGFDPGARTVYWAVKKDYATSLADGYPQDGRAGPTGSGLTQAGGVIRLSEMASGTIDHALSFITSRPVNRYRYPASHSDGNETGIGIEEGMRIQLDPTLDLDSLPGITPGEKAIARALQRYGAYCTDTGGGNNQAMGIYVEKPKSGDKNPYPAAGFAQDWAQLPHIPRDRLRVLAASVTPRPN